MDAEKNLNLDTIVKDYTDGLKRSKNKTELGIHISNWMPYLKKTFDIASKFTDSDFEDFQIGLKKERRGEYAGDEWLAKFGEVILPEFLMKSSMVADQYKAPLVVAMERLYSLNNPGKRR